MLQVAASGNVKECYGIEKAEIPANYAEVKYAARCVFIIDFIHVTGRVIRLTSVP